MKKKKRNLKYICFLIPILLFLSFLLPSLFFSNLLTKRQIARTQKDITNVKLLETKSKKIEKEVLNILPPNFEEVLVKNDLTLDYEDIVYFLNNGYIFLEQEEKQREENEGKKTDVYVDISSIYKNLSYDNDQIYVTSQNLSFYFTEKFKDIRNSSIEYDGLRKTLKRKLSSFQTMIAFKGGQSLIEGKGIYSLPLFQKERLENIARYGEIELIVEDDIENYESIQKYVKETASSFPQFETLSKEIDAVIGYLKEENPVKEKLTVIEIVEKTPPVLLKKEQKMGYLLKNVNNSLLVFPYITDDSNILSKDINNENFSIEYDITPSSQPSSTVRIPVLMYHHINYAPENSSDFKKGLYVTPEIFEEQIAYLTRKNYRSISTGEFFSILNSGNNPTQKTIVLSFDDSLPTHYSKAFPILKKYGHIGVFFVPSIVGLLSQEQLIEMSKMGMDIQSHSATHPILAKVSNKMILEKEIVNSKNTLEQLTGKPVNAFAYPGCVGNSIVFHTVLNSGYDVGFSCGRSIDHTLEERAILSRPQVYNEMEQFKRILSGTY